MTTLSSCSGYVLELIETGNITNLYEQVIGPERADIMWDTVEGILKVADMYEVKTVSQFSLMFLDYIL